MSTFESTYCSQADMQLIVPNIDEYDTKRVLPSNWTATSIDGVSASNLYHLYNSGNISQLYYEGAELTLSGDDSPSANNEFYYAEGTDLLSLYKTSSSATILNSAVIEGGRDFTTLITECRRRGSDMVRSFCSKPIYQRKGVGTQSAVGNDFPEIIVISAAHLACYFLVAPYNKDLADELMARVTNDENNGWLDKIRNGEINISQEDSMKKNRGDLKEKSINASTTGSIVAIRGNPSTDYDRIKIIISTAGTFTEGSASTVKFDSYIKDATGMKIDKLANATVMDGQYQLVGHAMYVRFSPGVYTINDEWELEVSGVVDTATMAVKSSCAQRRF